MMHVRAERDAAAMDTVVRAADVTDADAIAQIQVAALRVEGEGIVDPRSRTFKAAEELAQQWRQRIPLTGAEGHRTWVADVGDIVRGFAFSKPAEDDDLDPATIAELRGLYVAPDAMGQGVGSALLDRAVDGMRGQGFLQAVLWVLEGNERAVGFYAKHRWKPDGTRNSHFRVFDAPALRMRFPL